MWVPAQILRFNLACTWIRAILPHVLSTPGRSGPRFHRGVSVANSWPTKSELIGKYGASIHNTYIFTSDFLRGGIAIWGLDFGSWFNFLRGFIVNQLNGVNWKPQLNCLKGGDVHHTTMRVLGWGSMEHKHVSDVIHPTTGGHRYHIAYSKLYQFQMGRTRSLNELGASDQGSGDDHPGRSTESLMVFWARSSLRRFFGWADGKTTNFLGDVFCCVIADQIRWCTNYMIVCNYTYTIIYLIFLGAQELLQKLRLLPLLTVICSSRSWWWGPIDEKPWIEV